MYVYQAIRRRKENKTIEGPRVIRQVDYHDDHRWVEHRLKKAIQDYPGIWRIYKSVNRRDYNKARLELAHTLINQLVKPEGNSDKNPESLWKDILMKPSNKAERLFLVDVDSTDYDEKKAVQDVLRLVKFHQVTPTPNGQHIITDPFDPRSIEKLFPYAEVKKDALVYVDTVEVSEGGKP